MTKEALLLFIKRLLEKGSDEKSIQSLHQLKSILKQQNAEAELINLVEGTLRSMPEAKEAAKKDSLSEEELRIAIRRARDRRQREEEMSRRGRC